MPGSVSTTISPHHLDSLEKLLEKKLDKQIYKDTAYCFYTSCSGSSSLH